MTQVVRTAPTQNAISSFTRNEKAKEGPLSRKIAAKNYQAEGTGNRRGLQFTPWRGA